MADPVTLPQVIAELRSKDLEQVQSALAIVLEYDAPEIADALLGLLGSLSPMDHRQGYVLGQVIGMLGVLDERRALPSILALLERDAGSFEDDQLVEQACAAVVQLRAIEALPALRAGLTAWRDYEEPVADAIVELGGAAEIDFFTTALGARVQAVKLAALRALVALDARGAVARIEKLRTSKDADVRQAALAAFVQLAPERAPELLDAVFAAADLPGGNKMDAVKLATRAGSAAAMRVLLDRLVDPVWRDNPWARFWLLDALHTLGDPASVGRFETICIDAAESPCTRAAATARLVRNGRSELAGSLLETLRKLAEPADPRDVWNWSIETGKHVIAALDAVTAQDPTLRLRFIDLLDDLRREKLKIPYGPLRDAAGKVVQSVAGSAYFADFDRWRAAWIASH